LGGTGSRERGGERRDLGKEASAHECTQSCHHSRIGPGGGDRKAGEGGGEDGDRTLPGTGKICANKSACRRFVFKLDACLTPESQSKNSGKKAKKRGR